MNAPWWHGLPPVQTTIRCTGRVHRLRWAAGQIRAIDHEDAATEPGPPHSPCGQMLEAWTHHVADLTVLVLASRGPADPLAAGPGEPLGGTTSPPPRPAHQGSGSGLGLDAVPGASRALRARTYSTDYTIPDNDEPTGPDGELIALFSLDYPLQHRLAAAVIADWTRRLRHSGERPERAVPALHAALYGRLTAALRVWTRRSDLLADLTMIDETDRPSLTRTDDTVTARLPFGWLGDVWVKGLATTGEGFCIAAAPSDDGRWVLSTVDQTFGPPRETAVEFPSSDTG